jgi:hypothetical protein
MKAILIYKKYHDMEMGEAMPEVIRVKENETPKDALRKAWEDFYNGVLDEQDDNVSYSDWSKARSNEYKMWSNTRSDCYKQWSNMRSDVYSFWSDMRSEMYSDDIERAQKIFNKFMEDVQKMLG